MSGYYPPGVSGNEDAFGPRDEFDIEADDLYECENCSAPAPEVVTRVRWNSGIEDCWDCPDCGHENCHEVYEDDGPDPDEDWD